MYRAIIVEDDSKNAADLISLITETGEPIQILATCRNVNEGLAAITKYDPELIFLDVELGQNETGFDLIQSVQKKNFEVIFATSHNEAALRALRLSAIDFITKPVMIDELSAAIKKFILKGDQNNRMARLEALQFNTLSTSENHYLMIPDGNTYYRIETNNIVFCFSENTTVDFILSSPVDGKAKLTYSKESIGYWERLLEPDGFIRVNNSYLINMKHFKKYQRGDGGVVTMNNGTSIDVSRHRKEKLINGLKISR